MINAQFSTMAKKIKPGDMVMVCYSMTEQTNNPARKYDGETFVVKDVLLPKTKVNGKKQYTLFTAVSDMGKPYWFLEDELIKI